MLARIERATLCISSLFQLCFAFLLRAWIGESKLRSFMLSLPVHSSHGRDSGFTMWGLLFVLLIVSTHGESLRQRRPGIEDHTTHGLLDLRQAKHEDDLAKTSQALHQNSEEKSPRQSSCPVNEFAPFTVQTFSGDFLRYRAENVTMGDSAKNGDVMFTVTETCTYTIHEEATNNSLTFTYPGPWLDYAAPYFGGIPRTTNGAFLSGEAVPTMFDVKIEKMDDFFEVHIVSESSSIGGGAPLMWGFTQKGQAIEFEYFLISVLRFAPDVFLTGETKNCGSGPVCSELGNDVCYFDPKAGLLGLRKADNSDTFYTDSLTWFNECAKSLGCRRVAQGGAYLFFGSPGRAVEGTRFVFRDNGVDGLPIEYECFNVQDAHKLLSFIDAVAQDPFYPLAVGGPFQHISYRNP